MEVIIIEDEILLAEELKEELVVLDPSIKVVQQFSSVADSVKWLSNHVCDLIFSDIELSDGLSFSIFKTLDITIPVVFTTAYDQYAIKAFETNSIGYILKPVETSDLKKVLDKYWQNQFNNQRLDQLVDQLTGIQAQGKATSYLSRLILSMGNIQKPVSVDEIVCFMADDRYLFAYTQEGKKYYYDATLAQLEKELDPECFFRANRRYFINKQFVNEIKTMSRSRLAIKMTDEVKDEIVVSYSRSKEFKAWIVS
ncbi:LytR/AlgR family response regulator transcription factor [Saccharicrinis fermentans]|uniref:Sensory transduction protein LytR n=1 Tax=Saccharicrinis fermentans DSM 9555 = JCM 21142 TaxID=869213 RepID=W7YML1_9BACT|nr:LytTR family DNA-binding domain-containing protein [Saccharicrinis fermentans]GAF03624.1 sensory transduction protein LytR [Saccharicrinis fermentans DSM 9555 = JCM 21142]